MSSLVHCRSAPFVDDIQPFFSSSSVPMAMASSDGTTGLLISETGFSGLPGTAVNRDMLNWVVGGSLNNIERLIMGMSINQRREYELQLLICRYLASGLSVPTELLLSFRNTLLTLPRSSAPYPFSNRLGWAGNYHTGVGYHQPSSDPEPHRCRRTDGKKWRCARDVVVDQKYCERHVHRGKNRRKLVVTDNQPPALPTAATATAVSSVIPTVAPSSTNTSPTAAGNNQPMQLQQQRSNPAFPGCHSLDGTGSASNPSYNSSPLSTAKDYYRYLNGLSKSDLDIVPEHTFFTEASGHWPSKMQRNGYGNQQNARDIESGNGHGHGHGHGDGNGNGDGHGQPLRHFFDDWPRSARDNNGWPDAEEEKHSSIHGSSSSSSSTSSTSTTRLSISTPSPLLKLSMSSISNDEPSHMGMGMGIGLGLPSDEEPHHHHHGSSSIATTSGRNNESTNSSNTNSNANNTTTTNAHHNWTMMMHGRNHPNSHAGGPLAEALRSNKPGDQFKSASSPTAVLQSAHNNVASSSTFASFSDSSSGRSSPRATSIFPGLL